ncbi:MAG TPA: glycoside hydrolase family 3 N-terminal domain-containing protein [Acidimicrobiales bacterium]|jgi:beta-glucosidase|nr:glycoside hydrolase family 3 N-terminal domain-containing protein [Acidimicrobiales bacterium]
MATEAAVIDERVDDLLDRMTLDEKLAQIGSIWLTSLVRSDRFDEEHVRRKLEHGIGHVTRIGASTGLRPEASARLMNQIQRIAVEQTRLGIPVMVHEEAVAGYCAREATQFPQAIGLASTWDEALVEEVAVAIRTQMVAVGARHSLSPVLDVARDPRWGRVEETYGEDPYLVGRIGSAYVRGLQGALTDGVIATGKHFLGYGLPEGGMNHAPVHLGPRELREVYAEPFAAAIRDAGLASIMNSYSSVDGVPVAASSAMLDDLLRRELGFDGVVVADYYSVRLLITHHRVARDPGEAGARALQAGLDVELPGRECYGAPLKVLLADGRLPVEAVDRAVRRVLRSKFQTGLFDDPYVDEGAAATVFDTPRDRALARRAAEQSLVLLENDGLLPLDLSAVGRIAVLGPAADDRRLLQGDYHYPAHLEMSFEAGQGFGDTGDADGPAPMTGQEYLPDSGGAFEAGPHFVEHVTPLAGLRAALAAAGSAADIVHERGCAITGDDAGGIAAAVDAARSADVALVFVGGKSGLTTTSTVGEGRDASDLGLPGVQQQLVDEVIATGTPTVVVLVSGRVHAIPTISGRAAAVLNAWLPGEEGGNAIADVLLGRSEPGGRLPITMPRSVGQVPIHHAYRTGGGRAMFWGDYVNEPTSPLYAFGHGLTYTSFDYGDLEAVSSGTTAEPVVLRVEVSNTGARAGTEVVQLYVRDDVASVARPYQQLIGFVRVPLDAGATATVTFDVHPSRLAFYDEQMRFVVEPGSFRFSVGGASDRATNHAAVTLGGEVAEYRQREVVATSVNVR